MQPKRRWKRASANSSGSTDNAAASSLSEQGLYAQALKILTRRSYPVRGLEQKLLESCSDSTQISHVIERLKASGYLNDRKYIELFIQSRRDGKSQGRFRVATELRTRGLPPILIQEVLDEAYPVQGELEPLNRALQKKLRTLASPMDAKKLARLYNHLLRLGFPSEAIRLELNRRFKNEWYPE